MPTMRVLMIQTRFGDAGAVLAAGGTYTVTTDLGAQLVGWGYARDIDGVLNPQDPVSGAGTTLDVNAISELGDSYGINSFGFDTTYTTVITNHGSRGVLAALNAAMGAPLRKLYLRSKDGTTSAQWIASSGATMPYGGLVQALADNSYWVRVTFPTNDVNTGVTSAVTIANDATIFDAIQAAGKIPIPTLGGIVSGWSAGQYTIADEINAARLAYAQRYSLPWLDDRTMCEAGTRVLSAATSYESSAPYTHPNPVGVNRGALAQKTRLLPYLNLALLKASRVVALNANPFLGGGATPTSWAVSTNNAGAPARAAVVSAEGGWQTTFTTTLANGYDGLTQTTTLASLGLAVGDAFQVSMVGRIISATGGVTPRIYVTFTGSSTYTGARANNRISPDTNQLWSTDASLNGFTEQTPSVVVIPPGTTSLVILVTLEADNGAVVTAVLNAVNVVKVV